MGREYWILSPDNIPELVGLTGKTEDELEEMWATALKFGHVEVFWRIHNKWFNIRVSAEYVFAGMLDRAIEKAIEISLHE